MQQSPDRGPAPRCLCATLRRVSRVLNRRYEDALRPAGVSTSQFELMTTLRIAGPSSQTRLARLVEADQTTLSRNLKLLEKERWLETAGDGEDRRQRIYRLSKLGLSVLNEAHRRWQQAHEDMERQLGVPMSDIWPVLDRILQATRGPLADAEVTFRRKERSDIAAPSPPATGRRRPRMPSGRA